MELKYLTTLNEIVKTILNENSFKEVIKELKSELQDSVEPFIWKVKEINLFRQDLPPNMNYVWIFALKKNTPSIAHYHPNSIQHTTVICGKGKVKIADHNYELKLFDNSNDSWYIIDKNTPHEFFPRDEDMIVISFHTCLPNKLLEINCESGEKRFYNN